MVNSLYYLPDTQFNNRVCTQILMYAIAQWGCTDTVRESALEVDWEKNPLLDWGLRLTLVLCLVFVLDILPTELSPPHLLQVFQYLIWVCVCTCMCICVYAHVFVCVFVTRTKMYIMIGNRMNHLVCILHLQKSPLIFLFFFLMWTSWVATVDIFMCFVSIM